MINYSSNSSSKVEKILSDYLFLKSKEKNLDGILLIAYNDFMNNFELIHFYSDGKNKSTVQSIAIDDNLLNYCYLNSKLIDIFDEYVTGYILYDPKGYLNNRKNELLKSNEPIDYCDSDLVFNEEFISNITNYRNVIEQNNDNINNYIYEDILVDYYTNILYDNGQLDVYAYEYLKSYVKKRLPNVLPDDVEFQLKCLSMARIRTEQLCADNKQKKLKI